MPLVRACAIASVFFRRKGGFALKGGEIVEQGYALLGRFFLLFNRTGFSGTTISNGLGIRLVPDPFGAAFRLFLVFLKLRIKPATFVVASGNGEIGLYFPVVAGSKALISRSRWASMARVGVCARPAL